MSHFQSVYPIRAGLPCLRLLILAIFTLTVLQSDPNNRAQAQDKVVAVVNGSSITQKQVDDSITAQVFPLQQQIFALRAAALEGLILRTILEDEAKKRNISVEELRKQLTTGTAEVSAVEVEKLYAENASVIGAMSPDEAKERLRLDLETQARMKKYRTALVALRSSSKVEVNLEAPRLTLSENDRAPSIGSKDSPITITEFSDFQCPYCRGSQVVLNQILRLYDGQVKLIFKHLPLDIHAEAFSSAQAAFCAGQQGLFWKYHDALFASEDLSLAALTNIGSQQGLNLPTFKLCLTSDTSRAAVLADSREARQLGISSTPTFVVNGTLIRGAIGLDEFKSIIERESRLRHIGSGSQ
jgi:protein-disulfide isomerase